MKNGKVLVTDLLGMGNKVFHSGDTVTEENFHDGRFQQLVEGKFVELLAEEEPKPKDETKHKLTAEDLENNPDLVEAGLKVDDEIALPENYKKPDNKSKTGKKK